MNKKISKVLAVGTLSTGLVFGGATSAQAIDFYVPGTSISVTATKAGARTFVVKIKGGVFASGRTVTIRIPRALLARFGDVTAEQGATWTTTTNADGGIDPFTVEMPSDIAGTFTLTAESEDGTAVSSSFSVEDSGIVTASNDSVATGVDGAMTGLWVGGAAVVLAGGALLIGGRRSRREELGA